MLLEPTHHSLGESLWKEAQTNEGINTPILLNFAKDMTMTLHNLQT
jgi:hypothetical protein